MKKVLFSIGGLLIAALFVVSFTYVDGNAKDTRKNNTEISKDNPKGSCCASACNQAADCKAACDKEKTCMENCKSSDGKCVHQGCKGMADCANKEAQACCKSNPSTDCKNEAGGVK